MIYCAYGTNAFLSGPMTGYKNYNERKFIAAQIKLKNAGAEDVYNPILQWICEPLRVSETRDHESYMVECVQELSRTKEDGTPYYDVLVQLDGWKRSDGARVEKIVAESCGIPCVSIHDIV